MKNKTLLKILKNGGATLNKKGKAVKFKNGYQVSKKDCYTLSIDNINDILKSINGLLATIQNDEFCGVWVDSGKCYIDISIKIDNKMQAINEGKKLNQISIFDWSVKDCIYLKKQN